MKESYTPLYNIIAAANIEVLCLNGQIWIACRLTHQINVRMAYILEFAHD